MVWYAFGEGGADMKNIPMFTTENGVASLILQEIPYRQEAYVHIRSTAAPEAFFRECVVFCKMAGAEKVYLTGHPLLETSYSFHTSVLRLRRALPENRESGCLFPVQRETLEKFREIYNRRMAKVDNAATLTLSGAEDLLKRGDGYFVHDGKTLLGIGIASGGSIFRSNHASNYLPLGGTLNRDREALIHTIDEALDGKVRLRRAVELGL